MILKLIQLFPKRLRATIYVSRILALYPSIVFVKFCKACVKIKFFSGRELMFF